MPSLPVLAFSELCLAFVAALAWLELTTDLHADVDRAHATRALRRARVVAGLGLLNPVLAIASLDIVRLVRANATTTPSASVLATARAISYAGIVGSCGVVVALVLAAGP